MLNPFVWCWRWCSLTMVPCRGRSMAMGPCGRGAMGPYHPMVKWRNMERWHKMNFKLMKSVKTWESQNFCEFHIISTWKRAKMVRGTCGRVLMEHEHFTTFPWPQPLTPRNGWKMESTDMITFLLLQPLGLVQRGSPQWQEKWEFRDI